MYKALINKIVSENILVIENIANANIYTKYLKKALPLYLFALSQMKSISLKLNIPPLKVKIALAANWSEFFTNIKDSGVSRQLLIFEFAGILKRVDSVLIGRYGMDVNTYKILPLFGRQNEIQNKIEKIKMFYDNKSPLSLIKRSDLTKI